MYSKYNYAAFAAKEVFKSRVNFPDSFVCFVTNFGIPIVFLIGKLEAPNFKLSNQQC